MTMQNCKKALLIHSFCINFTATLHSCLTRGFLICSHYREKNVGLNFIRSEKTVLNYTTYQKLRILVEMIPIDLSLISIIIFKRRELDLYDFYYFFPISIIIAFLFRILAKRKKLYIVKYLSTCFKTIFICTGNPDTLRSGIANHGD